MRLQTHAVHGPVRPLAAVLTALLRVLLHMVALLRMNSMPRQPAAVLLLTPTTTATSCCSRCSSSSCGTRMVTKAAAAIARSASSDLMVGVVLR